MLEGHEFEVIAAINVSLNRIGDKLESIDRSLAAGIDRIEQTLLKLDQTLEKVAQSTRGISYRMPY